MKRVTTCALAALFASASPAFAGGLPDDDGGGYKDTGGYDEPLPLWTGFYAGVHAGYGMSDWDVDLSHTTGALIYDDPFSPDQVSLDDGDGWLGGVQAGANYQRDSIVVGLEADASWSDMEADGTFITATESTRWDIDSSLDAFGTVRGRLGFATDFALIYGTGGLAWGVTDTEQATTHNPGRNEVDGARVSGDGNHIGWTIGGGVEAMLGDNWSAKAEYLYVDLGEADYHLTGTAKPDSSRDWAEGFSQEIDFHTIRLGLNYQLN